jgi:hypothetical protein
VNTTVYTRMPFVGAISSRRGIAVLAVITVVGFFGQFPVTQTMKDHGASIIDFEYAGTTAKAETILAGYGDEGKQAAWWQLAIDVPFLIAYGLLIAGCCLAAAERLANVGRQGLARLLRWTAWCGPVAAACDMTQNVALAFELEGQTGQPAPRFSEVFGYLTFGFAGIGVATIAIGVAVLLVSKLRSVRTAGAENE